MMLARPGVAAELIPAFWQGPCCKGAKASAAHDHNGIISNSQGSRQRLWLCVALHFAHRLHETRRSALQARPRSGRLNSMTLTPWLQHVFCLPSLRLAWGRVGFAIPLTSGCGWLRFDHTWTLPTGRMTSRPKIDHKLFLRVCTLLP